MRKNIVCIVVLFCTLSLNAVEYETMYQGRMMNTPYTSSVRPFESAYPMGNYGTTATNGMATYEDGSATRPDGLRYTAYPVGEYSTGDVTTYGEGSAIHPRGPMRTAYNGGAPLNPEENDTWTDGGGVTRTWINGKWCVWNSDKQAWEDEDGNTVYEDAGDTVPVGEPLQPLLLAAAVMMGVIYWRQRKKVQ